MFCSHCGAQIEAGASTCGMCGKSVASVGAAAGRAAEQAQAASRDAMRVLGRLAVNPVGTLAQSYNELGDKRAFGAGIAFGVIFVIAMTIGTLLFVRRVWLLSPELIDYFGVPLGGAAAYLATFVTLLIVRKVGSGGASRPGFGGDAFVAGAATMPVAVMSLLAGLLGMGNFEVMALMWVFVASYCVLILYSGCTKISGLSDGAAAVSVPIVLLISTWLTKIVLTAIIF